MGENEIPVVNVVLGTAGHIDHGKTTLVKQLTGIDADRLQEEKDRGMTIDIGYAHMLVDQDLNMGVIDVPGHERFVRNMVAGATGFGLVVLVVAADDGIMPQTREHVEIMQILGLRNGICAVTKIDLVDEEMIEIVEEEIRDFTRGTFLESAEIHRVSSVTGQGIAGLKESIKRIVRGITGPPATGVFRLPIQRSFSAQGQGAVVTGVAVSGTVAVGDEIEILPSGIKARIKGMEAYGNRIRTARAGHRTALNLAGADYHAVKRGDVACEPGYLGSTSVVTARIKHLSSARKPLRNQTEIIFHTGTFESPGRIFLLEKPKLAPGEEDFVQIRLDSPAPAAAGDRFIARYPSPPVTAGGGVVIETEGKKLKPRRPWILERLAARREALPDPRTHVLDLLLSAGMNPQSPADLARAALLPSGEVNGILGRSRDEAVQVLKGEKAVHRRNLDRTTGMITDMISAYHRDHPMRAGMQKIEIRNVIGLENRLFDWILEYMESAGAVRVAGGFVSASGFRPAAEGPAGEAASKCSALFRDARFSPPDRGAAEASIGGPEGFAGEIVRHLLETGELVDIGGGMIFHSETLAETEGIIRRKIASEGRLVSAEFRDLVGTTRKFAIPLLEYYDARGLTIRLDNIRVLREHGGKQPGGEAAGGRQNPGDPNRQGAPGSGAGC